MLTEENEAGGLSTFDFIGDDLGAVPESHRGLVTPALARIFDDPAAYFLGVARRCPFANMAAWIRALVDEGVWALALHRSFREDWNAAGFCWWAEAVQGAEIAPPVRRPSGRNPPALARYHRVVDSVSWMPFGCSGGLYGHDGHEPLTSLPEMYHGREAGLDPASTRLLGSDPGGNNLIVTADGRGGWMSVESGRIRLLGTIEATIEWVYGEMLANRSPGLDYGWLMSGS